jgi:hypothetical protein
LLAIGFASASVAQAAASGSQEGMSVALIAFLVFGATILVFQLIPGAILLFSMIREIFAGSRKEAASVVGDPEKK